LRFKHKISAYKLTLKPWCWIPVDQQSRDCYFNRNYPLL